MQREGSPSKALVKGLAKELEIDESFLNRLADESGKPRVAPLPCGCLLT